MMYGVLTRNYFPLVATFSFGDAVAITYLVVYYHHTQDRAYAHKVLAVCGATLVATTTYAVLGGLGYTRQFHAAVEATVGYIGTAAVVLLYSSPSENITTVFKYRSDVFIPIQMVAVGVVNAAAWVTCSLLANDWFIFWPNAFTLAIGLAQVAVYMAFHPCWHPLPAGFDMVGGSIESPSTPKDLELGKADGAVVPVVRAYSRLASLNLSTI